MYYSKRFTRKMCLNIDLPFLGSANVKKKMGELLEVEFENYMYFVSLGSEVIYYYYIH